jgi:Flp pilus assembly protein TadG
MFDRICQRIHNVAASKSKGQIIIMVAVLVVSLMAMVGLAVDMGYAFAQRRTVQNAADAAALAGAHVLTQWSTSNPTLAASTDVSKMVSDNKMGSDTKQTYSCYYVDDTGFNLGDCSLPVPSTATGVHVKVQETHNTCFIRVIPGAPKTATTSASATAHVQGVNTGSDAPFVACGFNTFLAGGGTMSILLDETATAPQSDPQVGAILTYPVSTSSNYTVEFLKNNKKSTPTPTPSPTPTPPSGSTPTPTPTGGGGGSGSNYSINPSAVGQTFVIHDQHVADCGNQAEKFKGVSLQDDNETKTIPAWFDVDNGEKAGPTRSKVNGINGCQDLEKNPDGCVLIVPLATNNPAPSGGNFYVVSSAAFVIHSCSPSGNCHTGTLLGEYTISPPSGLGEWTGSNGWKPGGKGLVIERLTKDLN